MKDLNKDLENLNENLKNNSEEKLNFMANVWESSDSSKASSNKKKVLYLALFGLISASWSIWLQVNASDFSRWESMWCPNDWTMGYTHYLNCNDINRQMNWHFSSSSYWPDNQCSSAVRWDTHREKHMDFYQWWNQYQAHGDSKTNVCDVSTNAWCREANALSFNHNWNFRMDNVITNPNLNCRITWAHNSHWSHGSHWSHSSHASHGSHWSHSSHSSHGSHWSHWSHSSHGSHWSHWSHSSHASHASHANG